MMIHMVSIISIGTVLLKLLVAEEAQTKRKATASPSANSGMFQTKYKAKPNTRRFGDVVFIVLLLVLVTEF